MGRQHAENSEGGRSDGARSQRRQRRKPRRVVQRNGNGLRAFYRAHRYVRALDLCFFTGTFRARLWHEAPCHVLLRGDLLTLLTHTCLAVGKQARAMKQTGDGEVSCWGLKGTSENQ